MLKFVTKQEYWQIEDSGILRQLPNKFSWHLKSIQDAMIFQQIHQCKDKKIAEIGGGNSRIIPVISQSNECYNIDEFKGVGNGPQAEIMVDNVRNVATMIGTFSDLLNNDYFDIIFSISVVEHVPRSALGSFFKDCHRILKHKGTMIHAIDVYIEDDPSQNRQLFKRIDEYSKVFTNDLFKPVSEENKIISKEDIKFSTAFATNPDTSMKSWNKISPKLTQKRINSQCCTLLMMGTKK